MYIYVFPLAGAPQAEEDLREAGYMAEKIRSYKIRTDCPPEMFIETISSDITDENGNITRVHPEDVATGRAAKELFKKKLRGRCSRVFLEISD